MILGCMFVVCVHIAVYMYFIVWGVPRYTCARTSVKVRSEHRRAHVSTHACTCRHPCHSACMEMRGQLAGVDSLTGPHGGFQNQTLIDGLGRKPSPQSPLPLFFWTGFPEEPGMSTRIPPVSAFSSAGSPGAFSPTWLFVSSGVPHSALHAVCRLYE